eukprot:4459137-Prymnesium_polylepis.1
MARTRTMRERGALRSCQWARRRRGRVAWVSRDMANHVRPWPGRAAGGVRVAGHGGRGRTCTPTAAAWGDSGPSASWR